MIHDPGNHWHKDDIRPYDDEYKMIPGVTDPIGDEDNPLPTPPLAPFEDEDIPF